MVVGVDVGVRLVASVLVNVCSFTPVWVVVVRWFAVVCARLTLDRVSHSLRVVGSTRRLLPSHLRLRSCSFVFVAMFLFASVSVSVS